MTFVIIISATRSSRMLANPTVE